MLLLQLHKQAVALHSSQLAAAGAGAAARNRRGGREAPPSPSTISSSNAPCSTVVAGLVISGRGREKNKAGEHSAAVTPPAAGLWSTTQLPSPELAEILAHKA